MGSYDDPTLLSQLAARADVVTYEFENVAPKSVQSMSALAAVHPSATALAAASDRLREKNLFDALSIPTPPFAAVPRPCSRCCTSAVCWNLPDACSALRCGDRQGGWGPKSCSSEAMKRLKSSGLVQ